jgi:hypothetical protein
MVAEKARLYPSLDRSAFHINRCILPEEMTIPAEVDQVLAVVLPSPPDEQVERAAIERWGTREQELEKERAERGAVRKASLAEEEEKLKRELNSTAEKEVVKASVLSQFKSITAADDAQATSILHANDWNLEASIQEFFEKPSS